MVSNDNGTTYAFIDSQNLHLGVRNAGWSLDYKKFRLYLKNKFNVSKAYMFIGFIAENQHIYAELQSAGFILIFKQAITYVKDGRQIIKGNVDAEMVLYSAAIEYNNYDNAIIVTNDGDFLCLVRYLNERNKLKNLLAPNVKYSTLYKPYAGKIQTLNKARGSLEKK